MKINKILVEIHHGLGDVVQMIPLIENLRNSYAKAKISVIVASDSHADLLKCTNLVDEYYFLNLRKMKIIDVVSFIFKIRKEKYDICFLSPISNKTLGLLMMHILGCKNKVMEVKKTPKIFNRNNIYSIENIECHRIYRNLKLLDASNISVSNKYPVINLSVDRYKRCIDKLKVLRQNKKLIAICVGTNAVQNKKNFKTSFFDAKKWSIESYIQLINKLKGKYNIIIIGGKKEEDEVKGYLNNLECEDKIINFINMTSIMESAALLTRCDLVLGADTGMMHIADALGVNTLTLFGPTNPRLVGPISPSSNYITLNLSCQYCYGTEKLFECTDRKCINNISVEQVLNEIENILNYE